MSKFFMLRKAIAIALLLGLTAMLLAAVAYSSVIPSNHANAANLYEKANSDSTSSNQNGGGNGGLHFSNDDTPPDVNSSQCISVPTTYTGTNTGDSNFNFTNPGDYVSFVAGVFGQLASSQILSTSAQIINWGSGCANSSPNFVTQTADFNTIAIPSGASDSFDDFFWDWWLIAPMFVAVFMIELVQLAWKRKNGEFSDFEDALKRMALGFLIIIGAQELMDWLGTLTNTANQLFTSTGINPLTVFDPNLYTTQGKDAVLADPLIDALAAVSAVFVLQMMSRYLSLLFMYFIMPIAGVLLGSKVTEKHSLLLLKTYVCTMLVQPFQLAILYLSSLMSSNLQGTGTKGDKTISLLVAIAGVGVAIALPKLISAFSGGSLTIGAMALMKAGADLYQNSTGAMGEKAFNFASSSLSSMAMGGAIGGAMGFLKSARSGGSGGGGEVPQSASGSGGDDGEEGTAADGGAGDDSAGGGGDIGFSPALAAKAAEVSDAQTGSIGTPTSNSSNSNARNSRYSSASAAATAVPAASQQFGGGGSSSNGGGSAGNGNSNGGDNNGQSLILAGMKAGAETGLFTRSVGAAAWSAGRAIDQAHQSNQKLDAATAAGNNNGADDAGAVASGSASDDSSGDDNSNLPEEETETNQATPVATAATGSATNNTPTTVASSSGGSGGGSAGSSSNNNTATAGQPISATTPAAPTTGAAAPNAATTSAGSTAAAPTSPTSSTNSNGGSSGGNNSGSAKSSQSTTSYNRPDYGYNKGGGSSGSYRNSSNNNTAAAAQSGRSSSNGGANKSSGNINFDKYTGNGKYAYLTQNNTSPAEDSGAAEELPNAEADDNETATNDEVAEIVSGGGEVI